jgi:hypothetical protein
MVAKQIVFVTAVGAATIAAVLSISDVFASSAALPGPGVISVTTKRITRHFVDIGRHGNSVGDVEVTRELVYNRRITPKPIGHIELLCTFTGRISKACSGTLFMPRGRILFEGPVRYRTIFALGVVGGIGLYDNVKGTVTVTQLDRKGVRYLYYFRLIV